MATQSRIPPAGLMSRSAEEIARILDALHSGGREIVAALGTEDLPFRTRLLFVDPNMNYVVMEAPEDNALRAALFARPRLNFISEFAGWHIEFPVADPQKGTLAGRPAVRFRFPEVIVSHQRRAEERVNPPQMKPMRCIADAQGFAPFEGHIVDIAPGGIGFLLYSSEITLEPGTLLKGCYVEAPGRAPVVVDLEVRYSTPVMRPGGRHAHRSGCVFLNPTRDVMDLIDSLAPPVSSEARSADVPSPPEVSKPAEPAKSRETPKESVTLKPSAAASRPEAQKPSVVSRSIDLPGAEAIPRTPRLPKPAASSGPSAVPEPAEPPKPAAGPKPEEAAASSVAPKSDQVSKDPKPPAPSDKK